MDEIDYDQDRWSKTLAHFADVVAIEGCTLSPEERSLIQAQSVIIDREHNASLAAERERYAEIAANFGPSRRTNHKPGSEFYHRMEGECAASQNIAAAIRKLP